MDQDKEHINDDVLWTMLYQGLSDAKPGAPAWTDGMPLHQGLHLMANMVVRVLQQIFKTDDQVHPLFP